MTQHSFWGRLRAGHISHGWVLPLSVLTLILLHSAALSAQHVFDEILHHWIPDFAVETGLALTAAAASLFYFAARAFSKKLNNPAGNAPRSILDATLRAERVGWHPFGLFGLGVLVVGFLISVHLFSHLVWELLGYWIPHGALTAICVLAVLSIAWIVRRIKQPELHFRRGTVGKADALVLFLSSPGRPLAAFERNYTKEKPMSIDLFKVDFMNMMKQLESLPWTREYIKEKFGENSWAMPVRSVTRIHQEGSLRHVAVVGSVASKGFAGTADISNWFVEHVAAKIPNNKPEFYVWPKHPNEAGVDFERFEDIASLLDEILEDLKKRGAKRICIDITGGTKVCTIVGLMNTLDRDHTAVYVTTSKLRVENYDVGLASAGRKAVAEEVEFE